jgi:hypothetical protein
MLKILKLKSPHPEPVPILIPLFNNNVLTLTAEETPALPFPSTALINVTN